ncbi:MAG: DNA polymerase III subunit gamma/tau [Clostridia bacterium]|nr:DNA polymerase III subunit gamma/tau [Clostridia bacterium]
MSYMALYRKWRPRTFEEVVEQESVVNRLRNAVIQNRIAHAYLFSGTRGTGKTTLAKIFARAVNCLHPVNGGPCNECEICRGIMERRILDVSEIDAASNNGVDNIRSVIDDSAYSSSVARYRVYIIDEVHMLSLAAFNALLKTLEEPPENVIFILATTEPNKLPVTVLSRCQRFEFKRISRDGIAARLRRICDESGIDATDEALGFLAVKADGALRDAISLLDQTSAASQGKITLASARAATGSLDREFLWDFTAAVLNSDCRRLLELSRRIFNEGRDPSVFLRELIEVLRNMLVVMTVPDPSSLIFEDEQGIKQLKNLAKGLRVREISLLIRELSGLDNNLKWAVSRQIVFEAGILGAADRRWKGETASLETRLLELENRVADMADGLSAGTFVRAGATSLTEPEVVSEVVRQSESAAEPAAEHEIDPEPQPERQYEPQLEQQPERQYEPQPEPQPERQYEPQPEPQPEQEAEIKLTETPAKQQEANKTKAARKLDKAEWKRVMDEMEKRGQMSMLAWYMESTDQYELPGDRLLMAFEDDMTVSILRKSSPGNLKVVNESIAYIFGRPMEQMVALKGDAEKAVETVEREAHEAEGVAGKVSPAAQTLATSSAATTSAAGAASANMQAAAARTETETATSAAKVTGAGFDDGVRYFENLSKKMNFKIDYGDQ